MKRILLTIVISILVLIIAALIITPPVTRKYLVNNSPELIGRQIALEKLKVNYFRMSVDLSGAVLYEDDGETPFVSFDHLYVNLAPWHLFNDDLVIQELLLDGLKINIIQYDTGFNFNSMMAFFESDSTADKDTVQAGMYEFHFSNLEFRNGEFNFLDSIVGEKISMHDLNLLIPYIGWDQENRSDAGLKFSFANDGFFQSAFQMDPVGGHFDAEIKVNNLDLNSFHGYAEQYVAIDSLEGAMDTYVHISGNTNMMDSISIDGWADIHNLNITSNGNKELAYIDSLYCKLEQLEPMLNRYRLDEIKIFQPAINFDLYDSTDNISLFLAHLLDESDNDSSADTLAEADLHPLYYSINSFEVMNGAIDFTDHRYSKTFNYALSELEMAVDSINSTSNWIDATASMLLNNKGKLIASIGLDPSNPADLDLEYTISEFMLSDLNIYTNHYISHDIVFGDLYYYSDTRIRSGKLESENKLTIRDIEINKLKGGMRSIPLKLALFIITDKNGDVVLDIPLKGDLNDPEVNIGRLAWTTFKQFIGKIAASPYHFLAGLVSADPSDLKEIQYDFADTAFTHQKQKQLDLLLDLEQKKEGLDIQLVYFVDMGLEKEAITDTALLLGDPLKLDSAVRFLSEYRIQQLRSYITSINDSSNIRVHSYHGDAPKNVGAMPYFKVEYAILGEEDE